MKYNLFIFIPTFIRFSLFFLLHLTLVTQSIAQGETVTKDKAAFVIGAGNYEYLHAGLNINLKRKCYFETAIGIKPWDFKERYMMGYLCFGRRLFKEKEKPEKVKPYIHLKLIGWDFNNTFNHFLVLGINPEIRVSYIIKRKLQLCGNMGGLYNSMLYYKRKTYEEVAWPKEWQPSFSLQLLYRIK